ncbi:MAG: hypothetical protein WCJ04_08020 [Actinomycetes bacterium]
MSSTEAKKNWYYRLDAGRVAGLKLLGLIPGQSRAWISERFLRRPDQPGPAAEHVLQYLVSDTLRARRSESVSSKSDVSSKADVTDKATAGRSDGRKPVTVGQADFFYRSQYRQFCSPVMGAFAVTAPQVLAASGTVPSGFLWQRRRRSVSAMIPANPNEGLRPILVIDKGTVALAVLLPRSTEDAESRALDAWLERRSPMPSHLAKLLAGDEVQGESGVRSTLERSHAASVCEVVDAATRTGFLALLALHPYDPDAMGLHLTLFGVQAVRPERLVADYGLDESDLADQVAVAAAQNCELYFLVGGTAEVFTQCSQNLFTKRPKTEIAEHGDQPDARVDPMSTGMPTDESLPSLRDFLSLQFETLQATVAADGVPGASPRNGQIGRAAYLGYHRGRAQILIPYHPGNAIHGHAAKLWSNSHSSLLVSDDYANLRRVTISGKSGILDHAKVQRRFPEIARAVTHPEDGQEQTVGDPVYWFTTRANQVVWEAGQLSANDLTEERPACGIHAGGEGRHTKKPKYFDATAVTEYDMHLQHKREAGPRPIDPTGSTRAAWLAAVAPALEVRESHLVEIG